MAPVDDDEDELERTMTSETDPLVDPTGEFAAAIDELEGLLKNGDVVAALTGKNINASLALLGVDGLRAYLSGKKQDAADDFATVAEEIRARLAAAKPTTPRKD